MNEDRRDEEIAREIETHLHIEASERTESGMPPAEAAASARRAFGNVAAAHEATRAVWVRPFFDNIRRDAVLAIRGLLRAPAFAMAAIASLALGAGAAAAVFSFVDRLLFRDLPYAAAERLVSVGIAAPQMPYEFLFAALYLDARDTLPLFDGMGSWTAIGNSECDLEAARPVRLHCVAADASLLPVLGVRPLLGRAFTRDEDRPGAPRVALLSHAVWRTHFGADASILDRTVPIDGVPVRIVGVLPAGFEMPSLARADILVPQALDEAAARKSGQGRPLRAIARLKPGTTLDDVRLRIDALMRPYLANAPPQLRDALQLQVRPIRDLPMANAKAASWLLAASMIAFLLIAAANVSNLMLARAEQRERETAVRAALGASRWRIAAHSFMETTILSAAGAALGALLAYGLVKLAVRLAPDGIPKLAQASVDARVLAFTFAASLGAGLLAGLAPALRRPGWEAVSFHRAAGERESRLRSGLLAFQLAASLVLVSNAILLLRSLWNLETASPGMRVERVAAVPLSLGKQRYATPAAQLAFVESAEERLRALPGVTAVAVADSMPPGVPLRSVPWRALATDAIPDPRLSGAVVWRSVTPDYFALLDIPIVEGRGFSERDRGRDVVIVNQAVARALFPGGPAAGKRMKMGGPNGTWREVIGVARDVRNGVAARAEPEYWMPRSHSADAAVYRNPEGPARAVILVRSELPDVTMSRAIRDAIAAMDPSLPVEPIPIRRELDRLSARPRFNAAILGSFAAFSLLLAAAGIHGVASFRVARRKREIGVRMALGATAERISRSVAMESMKHVAVGAVVGLPLSFAAASALRSALDGVEAWTAAAPALCLLVLAAVCLLATWIPARRAAEVDPVASLRE